MGRAPTYNVVSSGEINAGFDAQQVANSCAKLFKTTPEKAQALLSKKLVLKKGLDLETARAYVSKLDSIGVAATVQEVMPEPTLKAHTLSLEPTEEELRAKEEAAVKPSDDRITCPKCNLEQPKADQCAGCGVYMHKVAPPVASSEAAQTPATTSRPGGNIRNSGAKPGKEDEVTYATDDVEAFNPKAIAAAAGAALLGALLWKAIAMTTGYEFSLIAWGIGGAVGFAALALGGRGLVTGVACGLLAFLAIMGGKYMVIQSFQESWFEILADSGEIELQDFRPVYDSVIQAANSYQTDVTDDDSLRNFMIEYGYTEASEPSEVVQFEIDDFKRDFEPELRRVALENPSFEQWVKVTFSQEIEGYSTFQLMREDFGLLDILFLFLGVGTAFQMGSGLRRH
ncbi:conserved hypothetical protein [Hahella chejuensis KCTC 2396]|uniref:Uncharacterized protein n=1 Tax=Hahella chejuensis (strain KCTC 2396) TaxID=349521 RepID=Q2SI31_HAHCH|nr:hypothetical protein [Hahella chejuensis]ABC29693.1 conserved hypothetical protein [Hahella chejuensis KCTC 2396]